MHGRCPAAAIDAILDLLENRDNSYNLVCGYVFVYRDNVYGFICTYVRARMRVFPCVWVVVCKCAFRVRG